MRDTYNCIYPRADQVSIFPGIVERLIALRDAGYLLVGVTNQGGVSTKQITRAEVEQANERTQELLGAARLDLIFYCPHHTDGGDPDCDCKKPAPGMLLDALAALPGSTLEGAFVVGDNPAKDKGAADMLALPFILADSFRSQRLHVTLASLPKAAALTTRLAEDRIAGVLVGMAVGDALAAPVEFWDRAKVRRTYPDGLQTMRKSNLWEKGEYTDDTQMALLIADSLLARQELDAMDLAKRFREWARTAKDVGNQTRRVFRTSGYEESPEARSRKDYEANPKNAAGNGAVMRCAPIALFRSDSLSMLLADSRRSARITHGDPKAQSSCVLVNVAILHLINGGAKESAWRHGMKFLMPYEKKAWVRLDLLPGLKDQDIQSGGYTVPTVEAAFWCFEHSTTFREAIEMAASLGDDADTVAAVTGAIAGAHYGYEGIPEEWRKELKDGVQIRKTALALAFSIDKTPRPSAIEPKENSTFRLIEDNAGASEFSRSSVDEASGRETSLSRLQDPVPLAPVVSRLYERDVDLLLAEEFQVSPPFAKWFLSQSGYAGFQDATVVEVAISKSDNLGESDLVVLFDTGVPKERFALFIEDKIDAPLQPKQLERYRLRAQVGVHKNLYATFAVVLCSPAVYVKSHAGAMGFDAYVSHEAIAEFLRQFEPESPRNLYRASMIARAAHKSGSQWQQERDVLTDSFWGAAYAVSQEFPALEMKVPVFTKGETWTSFRPLDMPTQPIRVSVLMKGDRGYMDLTFTGALSGVLVPLIKHLLDEDMSIHQTGKSTGIRLKVQSFTVSEFDEAAELKIRSAFTACERLIGFYRQHRVTLDAAAAKSMPPPIAPAFTGI